MLCSLTFVGEGYSDSFVANFRAIVGRISAGEEIALVWGPDDICMPLLADAGAHCSLARIDESDALTVQAFARDDRLRALLAGGSLDVDRLAALRVAFSEGTIRAACRACSWNALCTTVATEAYERALLVTGPGP